MRKVALLALGAVGFACLGTSAEARGIEIARDGVARATIVVAQDAQAAEISAAEDLARHLESMTGARFRIVAEPARPPEGPTIQVGPTERVRSLHGDPDVLGPERWFVRTSGSDLLLWGGRPRGALYAVYHFLEDRLGVRWWTPFEDGVPERPTIRLGRIDDAGEPAFSYRDVYQIPGPPAFAARSRLNGHFSRLPPSLGGRERYGPPSQSHTFFHYVPPAEHFAEHPEFYSEIDGERRAEGAQLCLSNDAVFELVDARLAEFVAEAQRTAEREDEPPARLFDFSANDQGNPCACADCRAALERFGSHAGSLATFVNRLAERHPDITIDTLAYYHTFRPPRDLELRENVVIRLSALQYRDFLKPLADPAHEPYRRAIEEWRAIAAHLRIWDYTVTFPEETSLPLPNLGIVAADLRDYLEQGVEGLFLQHDHPIAADLRDLKLWVLVRLLEDPSRSLPALVRDFTDGYYGRAGPFVRRYLRRLERAARRNPERVGYPARIRDFRWIDARFVAAAHAIFDRAAERVEADPLLSRRLRHARMSLDWATIARLRPIGSEAAESPRLRERLPDPREVASRLYATWAEQLELRQTGQGERTRVLEGIEEELRGRVPGWGPGE